MKNKNTKIWQALSLFLIIGISLGLGRLSVLNKGVQTELVIKERKAERLVLKIIEIKENSIVFRTSNSSIAKTGDRVLEIKDNQFEIGFDDFEDLVVYNQDQEIEFSGITSKIFTQMRSAEAVKETVVAGEAETPVKEEVSAKKVFVGSKNSNKYHPPDCKWAKQIKPANEVWFSSHEDAQAKGYKPSSCFK